MIRINKENKSLSEFRVGTNVLVANRICSVQECENCKTKFVRKEVGKNRATRPAFIEVRPSNTKNCSKKCCFEMVRKRGLKK